MRVCKCAVWDYAYSQDAVIVLQMVAGRGRALLLGATALLLLAQPAACVDSTNDTLSRLVAACTRQLQQQQDAGTRRLLAGERQQQQRLCQPEPRRSLNSSAVALACPASALVSMLSNPAHPAAQEAFSLPACSLWPVLEGRTLWLVGGEQVRE